jgi:hypothetical protein
MQQAAEALSRFERELADLSRASFAPEAGSAALDLRKKLHHLMVDGRPLLEQAGELLRPYELLAKAGKDFDAAAKGPRGQRDVVPASLLPVPGQWTRLNNQSTNNADPATQRFLAQEALQIQHKADKKIQTAKTHARRHKPWNFLQILKPPISSAEKGVLRIFSMPYLLATPNIASRLGKDWTLLVEPAAGVNLRHTWMRAFLWAEAPPVFGAAGAEDAAFFRTQGCLTVQLAHSDYLPAREPVPLRRTKRYDLLFIGLYDEMERKRHGLLLDLMAKPELSSTTALVLGRGSSQAVETFNKMITQRGLQNRVTALANVDRRLVPAHIAECRLALNLSLHENGCRAIAECLRSDVPLAVSACTAGVNFEQINEDTGVVASDNDLPGVIADALARLRDFRPRQWFLEHSGDRISTRRLNEWLQQRYKGWGMDWTRDICGLTSSGPHRHADPQDLRRLGPFYRSLAELLTETGLRLPLECPAP